MMKVNKQASLIRLGPTARSATWSRLPGWAQLGEHMVTQGGWFPLFVSLNSSSITLLELMLATSPCPECLCFLLKIQSPTECRGVSLVWSNIHISSSGSRTWVKLHGTSSSTTAIKGSAWNSWAMLLSVLRFLKNSFAVGQMRGQDFTLSATRSPFFLTQYWFLTIQKARSVLTANSTFAHIMQRLGFHNDNHPVKPTGDAFETILAAYHRERGLDAFNQYVRQSFSSLIQCVGHTYHDRWYVTYSLRCVKDWLKS